MKTKKIYGIKEIGPFHAVRVALRLFLFWGKRQASPGQVSSPISDIAFRVYGSGTAPDSTVRTGTQKVHRSQGSRLGPSVHTLKEKPMLRSWIKQFSVVAAVMILMALPLSAQQSSTVTGGLNGTVVDSTSAAVQGATITLTGPQGTKVIVTDAQGHYGVSNLIPGFYDVAVEKTGFKKIKSAHNEVVVNVSSLLNFTLPVGNTQGTVEVRASAVSIYTESTAIDSNLTDT